MSNNSNLSLANRKQLADMLGDKYDGMRSKAKSKLAKERSALYDKYLDETAEKKSALKLVEQIKMVEQKIDDFEEGLRKLGFENTRGELYVRGDVGDSLRKAIEKRVDNELDNSEVVDARFDAAQIAMMTVASLEDAGKLLKSVQDIK